MKLFLYHEIWRWPMDENCFLTNKCPIETMGGQSRSRILNWIGWIVLCLPTFVINKEVKIPPQLKVTFLHISEIADRLIHHQSTPPAQGWNVNLGYVWKPPQWALNTWPFNSEVCMLLWRQGCHLEFHTQKILSRQLISCCQHDRIILNIFWWKCTTNKCIN